MFVAHDISKGEFVCQIPVFPPYTDVKVHYIDWVTVLCLESYRTWICNIYVYIYNITYTCMS